MMTKRRPKNPMAKIEQRHAYVFMSPALIGLSIFTVLPVLLSILMSLYDWPIFGDREFIGFGNYIRLLTEDPDFLPSLWNSALFTILYVPLNMIVALTLAISLSNKIRGRAVFRVLFFIPVITPIVANVLIWKMLLQPQGLFNGIAVSWFGTELPMFLADKNWAMIAVVIMSVWAGMGYNMLILSAAYEQLPVAVTEAAMIDGARGWRMLFKVTLPMMSPTIFFTMVMTLISSLQVFAQPQLLTGGGPGNSTTPVVMFIYKTGFTFQELGLAAAGAWILFVVIIVLTALQFSAQKRWVHYEH